MKLLKREISLARKPNRRPVHQVLETWEVSKVPEIFYKLMNFAVE